MLRHTDVANEVLPAPLAPRIRNWGRRVPADLRYMDQCSRMGRVSATAMENRMMVKFGCNIAEKNSDAVGSSMAALEA